MSNTQAELVAARLRQRVREFAYYQGYGVDEDAKSLVLNGDASVSPDSFVKGKLLAVQIAKNTSTSNGDIEGIRRDHVRATRLLAGYADIIVVNISCPSAPDYRELQQVESLTKESYRRCRCRCINKLKTKTCNYDKGRFGRSYGRTGCNYVRCSMGVRRRWSCCWKYKDLEA